MGNAELTPATDTKITANGKAKNKRRINSRATEAATGEKKRGIEKYMYTRSLVQFGPDLRIDLRVVPIRPRTYPATTPHIHEYTCTRYAVVRGTSTGKVAASFCSHRARLADVQSTVVCKLRLLGLSDR